MSGDKSSETVKVIIRCRPINEKEKADGHERIVKMNTKVGTIGVTNPKAPNGPPKQFTFDSVYDSDSKQLDLYDETFRGLVDSVLDGFNGTIFAYGQTGTGKTFTMQGVKGNPDLQGMIPNSFDHIFTHIGRSENQQYLIRASYLEIYQEYIKDLLTKDQSKHLELKERPDTGVYVKDLSSYVAKSIKEIERVMDTGDKNRSVGATNMNAHSSRSHAIFIITVECSEVGPDGEAHIRVGKLNLVDLAGSERQAKTGSEGNRFKEATKINLSLSALGNVISALVDGKHTHIPYRDSMLTRLLQDSLGGNAKTVMVANIGPASYNFDETVTTLRWANRAKNIKNKPKINEDPKDALLREFQEEIARLKAHLDKKGGPREKKKRRKQSIGPNGEIIEEEEEVDDDDEEGEVDPEAFEMEQREKLEKEREAILSDHNLIAEEKQKLLAEAEEREDKLRREREVQEGLASKIKAMESKLLCGGENIVDHTNEQQRALEQRRKEIADQKNKEREMLQQLEKKEEEALNLQESHVSLQQEVDIKTKKLKKMFNKLEQARAELTDLKDEFRKEREDLEQTQEELTRELKLKLLIIENFIPSEENTRLVDRALFDEDEGTWHLQPLHTAGSSQMMKRPLSAAGNRRPVSQYAKVFALQSGNPRFKGENIISIELDLPNRTTRDYEGPTVAPRVQAAIDEALQEEEDILLDGRDSTPGVFKTGGTKPKGTKKKKGIPTAAARSKKNAQAALYPSSRGLVPK